MIWGYSKRDWFDYYSEPRPWWCDDLWLEELRVDATEWRRKSWMDGEL